MKLTFRTKLMTAFLLFALVPAVIMTFVTSEATRQVTDTSARLVYRGAYFASQVLIRSPLDKVRDNTDAILDRTNLAPVNDTFDEFLKEYTVLSRFALVAPDGMVVATRTRPGRENSFAAGQKIQPRFNGAAFR